jgi:hypothetical protein
MIGGTSGSDKKLCQPCLSRSKRTQTRKVLGGITEHERAFGSVLLALLGSVQSGLGLSLVGWERASGL